MSNPPKRDVQAVRDRDGGCIRCGYPQGNIHHRMMRSQAPKDRVHDIANMIVLCGSGTTGCHGHVHAHPAESYELGYLVRSYSDPTTRPVRYSDGAFYILDNEGNRTIKETDNG